MNKLLTAPVTLSERFVILDVLRGFALLGVLLDNVFSFAGFEYVSFAHREALSTFVSDAILTIGELVFVRGKFYSLFSLLFGIGFAIILVRNEKIGGNPLRIFYRRLLFLSLIGAVHLFFLWEGDILLFYALLGCLLPLFRRCSDKKLLILAAALIGAPLLVDVIKVVLDIQVGAFLGRMAQGIDEKTGIPFDENFALYLYQKGGGWLEWMNWQKSGFLYRYAYLLETNRIFKVLGMFLLGFYVGRKMMYSQLEQYTNLLKKVRNWGFAIGLGGSLGMAFFEMDGISVPDAAGLVDTLFYAIGVAPLGLAYAATLCLFWVKADGNSRWKLLAPVGRMALTNYLMQTILGILLFYSVGFGLGGNMGPTKFIPIALGIFIVQILYSHWWLSRFNYGPMEWIWRQLTYGRRLRLFRERPGCSVSGK